MYTFRFNPVFQQWVMLGGAVAAPQHLTKSHLIGGSEYGDFVTATYPRQPFVIEPPVAKVRHNQLAFHDEPAVGEYELLLYRGKREFARWSASEWDEWLAVIQRRLIQFHHNPYLHSVAVAFHTGAWESVEGYGRAGDLVATSHPISGFPAVLEREVAEKIARKEGIFTVWENEFGRLYVPSAPLQEKELWYIPSAYQPNFERLEKSGRQSLAEVLATLVSRLLVEYDGLPFVIKIHTSLAGKQEEATWWLQMYRQESHVEGPLSIRSLPEQFVQQLRYLL